MFGRKLISCSLQHIFISLQTVMYVSLWQVTVPRT